MRGAGITVTIKVLSRVYGYLLDLTPYSTTQSKFTASASPFRLTRASGMTTLALRARPGIC